MNGEKTASTSDSKSWSAADYDVANVIWGHQAKGTCFWEGASMDRQLPSIGGADKSDDLLDCVSDLLMVSDGARQSQVIGLPSGRELRSLVVLEDRRAAVRLVRRQFGGGGPRRNFQTGAVAVLIMSGLATMIPALHCVVPAARPGLGYRDWLRQALPEEARVGAVLLGPLRSNRKPVVLLTNGSGHLVAVAKFGVNKVTRPLVRHEAIALEQVSDVLGDTVHVPGLLASGSVGKGEVVLMAPLPAAAPGHHPSRKALIELVRAVAAIDRRPGLSLREVASHPRLTPLRRRIDEVMGCNDAVEVGSFHGDLHPGNLAVARDGRVILWDWERWGHGAPVGFDLLHHDLQSWIHRDGIAPMDAAVALIARADVTLSPLGVRPSSAPAVARDYLIRLAARYAADEQDQAGSVLGKIEHWLFPAVLG